MKRIATDQQIALQQAAISLHGRITDYLKEFEMHFNGKAPSEEQVLADIIETYREIAPELSEHE